MKPSRPIASKSGVVPCPRPRSITSGKTSPGPEPSSPTPITSLARHRWKGCSVPTCSGPRGCSRSALDAYYCDAYTDLVASTASSKDRQPGISLPEWVYDIKVPIRAVLEDHDNSNWRWRMAARKMMDRENVVSLPSIQQLFNKFFRKGHRFFRDLLDGWITRPDAKIRLFGVAQVDYLAMIDSDKHKAREGAIEQFEERFRRIFQRRHDCIHDCDRPKMSPQPLASSGTVSKVISDIEYLVHRSDEHIHTEFRQFLVTIGCSAATIAPARY